jgi:chromosome segregation ATPase
MSNGFLNDFKALFIVPEEGTKPTATTTAKSTTPSTTTGNTSVPTPKEVGSDSSSPGKVNDKFLNVLFTAIEKSNQEGFDYLEFRNSLHSLKEMNMDEMTRFKSAMAMAKSMGASLQTIVASGQFYLQVLKTEQGKFDEAMKNQRSQQIGNKEQQMQDFSSTIKAKEEEIKKMQQEIEQTKQKYLELAQQIKDATLHIESTKNDFVASYESLAGQIQGDLNKIQEYMK